MKDEGKSGKMMGGKKKKNMHAYAADEEPIAYR